MNIQITFGITNPDDLAYAIQTLQKLVASEKEPVKKEASKKQAIKKEVEKIEEVTTEEVNSQDMLSEIRELVPVKAAIDKPAVVAKLKELGAAKVPELKEKHYASFIEFLLTIK